MNTLPLTVLAYEGPQVAAYLLRLRAAGYRPAGILLLVAPTHPATGKPVGRWLPGRLRLAYAERVQSLAHWFWPRRIRQTHAGLVERMERAIGEAYPESAAVVSALRGPVRYEDFADEVRRVLAADYRAESLGPALTALGQPVVLYTGGGLLPAPLLATPGLRFLHLHPGYLPHVRGADGLLWSTMVRGRPGMSVFFMVPELDAGDVVCTAELESLAFDLSGLPRPDDPTLYRALFAFYDPVLRAEMLARQVAAAPDLADWPATPQDREAGVTYHFMHEAVRGAALARVFTGGPE